MEEYDVEPLTRGANPKSKGNFVINSLKKVAQTPFKLAGALVEKLAAPVVMAPYQLATDAVVNDKLKKPFEYKHDVEFGGLNVPVSHKLDASKSSVDRGFSFNRGGFTTDYNIVLDHEIRLGEAKAMSDASKAAKYAKNRKVSMSKPLGTGLHPLNR